MISFLPSEERKNCLKLSMIKSFKNTLPARRRRRRVRDRINKVMMKVLIAEPAL